MSDTWLLRTGILAAGVILMIAIIWFGRPKKTAQGRKLGKSGGGFGDRAEPTLADVMAASAAEDAVAQDELDLGGHGGDLGRRVEDSFDKIVSLFVAARAGQSFHGPDIVVAAEKTGLTFGHMNVFHRLIDRHPEQGPVFSVANIMKPGSFDMAQIQALETPALAFFLTLPAPVSALEAWDMMLPTAQRIAELLDGVLLDEERNALGRQRIQHIRDELRAYDRQREAPPLNRGDKW
ncbi:cell division protein ZipA [Solilutibacter silvestris]|uniref:Cell division protein ZipA n=1 Tax=Solilutibacter silvestris TaxID=1645665 RepID=A0A2K1PZI3_9GAMM|nr:cell division protein ZipA [Lysobacter silvestris]PNS08205.1 cell division protein ZipA [Lysobacter silvestris]